LINYFTDEEAIFLGEVVHKMKGYSNYQLKIPFTELGVNSVFSGGWQYCLCSIQTKLSKSLAYYQGNMRKMIGCACLSDAHFVQYL